jgi:hypothetical protein
MTSTTLLPPRRPQLLVLALIALVAAPGCAKQRIEASRRSALHEYRAHLATYTESAETPEQAARTAQLREQALHAEWVQRGHRVGDDWGADKILYSATGMGFFRGTGYLLFGLPGELIAYSSGDNPAKATRQMQEDRSSDARRRGINDLLRWDFAHNPPYLLRYREIARNDPDPYVRSVAIRALNRCRDADSRPTYVAGLSDNSPLVRLESVKALVNLPDPSAAEGLIRLVTKADEDRDVRIAAADALGSYRRLEVARALTPRLAEHDFSVAWQARRSLRRLTGRDFRYDEAAWLEYITGPDKPFG